MATWDIKRQQLNIWLRQPGITIEVNGLQNVIRLIVLLFLSKYRDQILLCKVASIEYRISLWCVPDIRPICKVIRLLHCCPWCPQCIATHTHINRATSCCIICWAWCSAMGLGPQRTMMTDTLISDCTHIKSGMACSHACSKRSACLWIILP